MVASEQVLRNADLVEYIIEFVPIDYADRWNEPPISALDTDPWLHPWFTWNGIMWVQMPWGKKHRQRIRDEIEEYYEEDWEY
jgi:hypothetical protein